MSNAHCVTQESKALSSIRDTHRLMADEQVSTDDVRGLFLGTWRLIGFSQNGRPHPVYGRAPTGTIRYEADGNMAVQIMPDTGSRSGAYRIDAKAKTVAHERVGNVSPGESRTVVRHYEFLAGGRLALTLDEAPTSQVLWQRVQLSPTSYGHNTGGLSNHEQRACRRRRNPS